MYRTLERGVAAGEMYKRRCMVDGRVCNVYGRRNSETAQRASVATSAGSGKAGRKRR